MFNFGKQDKPTKDELYIRDIVVEYLKNEKVKKEVTPVSNVYYLSNFDENIFIMLTDSVVQITNHRFFYKKTFAIGFVDRLKKLVDKSIEDEKEAFKKRIFSNEIDLLRGIFKAVEND